MAEAIILPIAKSILAKIASYTGDLAASAVTEEIKAAKSAKKDLKKMADKLEAICAVLEDAEERQYANKRIQIWIRDLKRVVYDIDDLLDELAFHSLQRRVHKGHFLCRLRYYLSFSNPLISSFNLSHKIRHLREQLDHIVAKKNDFGLTERPVEYSTVDIRSTFDGSSYVHVPDIIGRDEAKQDILDKLIVVNDASELFVLPIVGMGGIGKTAFAKLVHKDIQHFDLKLWICVSDKFDMRKIIEDILKDGTGDTTPNQDMNILVKKLHDLLKGNKYFLVLDDVWVDDIATWAELKNVLSVGKAGSGILITTRNPKVASITETLKSYYLDSLPHLVCWSIFKQLAFKEGEEDKYPNLCEIGKSIIKKCCGIPLVVKSLGSLLRSVRDDQEWRRINNMDSFNELNQHYDKVLQLLKLSYDKLPSQLKPCFIYLAFYVKGSNIGSNYVSYMWSALGLLPLTNRNKSIEGWGYSTAMEMVSKSLLQDPSLHIDGTFCKCKMHDLLHDLAVKILGEELVVVTSDKQTVSEFVRHIVWVHKTSNSLKDEEFPMALLKAINVRTFRFGYAMNRHISRSFLKGIISNFTCLRILELHFSWFEELPESIGKLKHLRYLNLSYNRMIKSLPNSICKLLNLETLLLEGCEQLKELPRDVHQLQSLRNFRVTTCQVSLIGTKFIELSSLQSLTFHSCKRLISLWDNNNVGKLTSLRSLSIINCPKLTCLPNSMKFLVGLQVLHIENCEELDLEKEEGLQGLQSLRYLSIKNPKSAGPSQSIQLAATSLQHLQIKNCSVDIPEWLLYIFLNGV